MRELQHEQQIGEASETKRTINRKAEESSVLELFCCFEHSFSGGLVKRIFDVEGTSQANGRDGIRRRLL